MGGSLYHAVFGPSCYVAVGTPEHEEKERKVLRVMAVEYAVVRVIWLLTFSALLVAISTYVINSAVWRWQIYTVGANGTCTTPASPTEPPLY